MIVEAFLSIDFVIKNILLVAGFEPSYLPLFGMVLQGIASLQSITSSKFVAIDLG